MLGDLVLIENGKTPGVVCTIIESYKEAQAWGLEEAGISIKAEPFGLVFWPRSETKDPVVFVSRVGADPGGGVFEKEGR